MAKVLITGIAGFIGSNLAVRLLEEGYEVIGIDNLSAGVVTQVPEGVDFHKLDIRSKDIYPLFKDVEYVFHLAAKSSVSECQQDPVDASDNNSTGTVNVFEASARAGIKKIIYAETSALYEGSEIYPTPESDVHPHSFYALSKMTTNIYAQGFQKFRNLKTVAVRYFNVYGPRQDYRRTIPPVMSALIIKLLRGENPIIYGDGEKRRDFVYVDDVNDVHLLLMKDDRANNEVFNIGCGVNYSINEIYKMIRDITGVNLDPIYKDNLEGEAQVNLGDCSKLKSLGWNPKTTIEEGLKIQIDYIKKNVINA
ncbi:MAG: NAD-dependent epimerase/dehydratase family protein [Patescibacteria group bacterium]